MNKNFFIHIIIYVFSLLPIRSILCNMYLSVVKKRTNNKYENKRNSEVKIDLFILYYAHLSTSQCILIFNF